MNIYQLYKKLRRLIARGKQQISNTRVVQDVDVPIRDTKLCPGSYIYSPEDAERVRGIVLSGALTHDQGEEIVSLEREFGQYIGSSFSLATNSGTSALIMACRAIGIGPGDEVIVPAYTFIATAQAVLQCGALPVFADIDDTFTISPESIKKLITKKTKAIVVVHIFGNVCNMDAILSIAKKYAIPVIEDCAQAIGATYKNKEVGSIGDIGCFSFNRLKALPTGQGGMFTTSNEVFFRRAMAYRNTGIETNNGEVDICSLGETLFMTELEASLARSILRQIESLNARRRKNMEYLKELLFPLRKTLTLYQEVSGAAPSYSRLSFLLDVDQLSISRKSFIEAMNVEGIPIRLFYPTPLYAYSLFQKRKNILTGSVYPFSENTKRRYNTKQKFVEIFSKSHIGMEFSPYWEFSDMRDIANAFVKVIERSKKSRKRI